ncbi:hypothetical protein [Xenorhabdus ishibashii]|uniref:Uncharacterized protein n=1 Tax=Xenorhabdus ishibashii TaxID=1034471 RepID=A0A2D0K7V5_9GAMM|nr:hypothetical protein [Xenorhabdus ishibashii]PHM59529.1 hypothetical protein Xish_03648 [Xenorhabdus ishibashii]
MKLKLFVTLILFFFTKETLADNNTYLILKNSLSYGFANISVTEISDLPTCEILRIKLLKSEKKLKAICLTITDEEKENQDKFMKNKNRD